MPNINPERLLESLRTLRSFGACGTGVVRRSLSEVDIASRHWLVDRMGEAGLEAHIDGVGNVIGRSRNAGPALLIGSHTDTQPTGGWLDGALGVMYGIEVARAFAESQATRALALEVASWIDEEGTYVGMLGSRSFTEDLPSSVIEQALSREGQRLTDAFREAGLEGVAPVRVEPERYVGYLEAHIEQGPYLEAEEKRIGVVSAIIGMRDFHITFTGQQNHAGTTPMHLRKDAGAALLAFAHRLQTEFVKLAAERTVWTIGQVSFVPGAPSIIPGKAEMILQFRDPEEAILDELQACTNALIAEANAHGPVELEAKLRDNAAGAAAMHPPFQQSLERAAEAHAPGNWMRMTSGAAHDAQILSKRMPAGMLFVPSIGGISHDFAEDTRDDDIVLGCQVLATAAASILTEAS